MNTEINVQIFLQGYLWGTMISNDSRKLRDYPREQKDLRRAPKSDRNYPSYIHRMGCLGYASSRRKAS